MTETKRNSCNDLDIVHAFITDSDKYALTPEVVLYALYYMREKPEATIEDAMNYGYWEWCK